MSRSARPLRSATTLVLAALLAGCEQPRMADQNRYDPYERAPDWPGGSSARQPVAGTVARGEPLGPRPEAMPLALDRQLLEHGREQYEINCTPCHGATGAGDGMIVQRGFPEPPTFHSERLRDAPLTHFYDVITDGYGVMYAYADRVERDERWAVAAYIRALQLSQHADPGDLSPEQRRALEGRP
ncbi:MAG: cytochrome c [Halofilum sp. (in: g-proteobacteria)]